MALVHKHARHFSHSNRSTHKTPPSSGVHSEGSTQTKPESKVQANVSGHPLACVRQVT